MRPKQRTDALPQHGQQAVKAFMARTGRVGQDHPVARAMKILLRADDFNEFLTAP
jgi:hypothetical protein